MNKEQRREYNRQWKERNHNRCIELRKEWVGRNPNKWAIICRKYNSRHKPQVRESQRKYRIERRLRDLQFRLAGNLRSRIRESINNNVKCGSSVVDLGCSITEFKSYIESKWMTGMTWENYGRSGWHLDHIIPLASFDLTDRTQFLKACHYTNYQPLWAIDNIKKSDKEMR